MLRRADIRREDGFTLPELLITMIIALIVSAAALSLVEFTMKQASNVDQRADANQRGRLLMDTITRQLRSQVCKDSATAAMATRTGDITDGNNATFYADLALDTPYPTATPVATPVSALPDLHSLVYDPVARTITERDYKALANGTYPTTPTTRVLGSNIVPVNPGDPIFTYYKYDQAATPSPSIQLTPGAGGLTLADLATVARIDVAFRTLPSTTKNTVSTTPNSLVLTDEVYVRAADPNDPAPTPTCA